MADQIIRPGEDVRVYRVDDPSVQSTVRADEGGADLSVRDLEPGAYVARGEGGGVVAFHVWAGVDETIVQPGGAVARTTTFPGGESGTLREGPLVPDEVTQTQHGVEPLQVADRSAALAREQGEVDRFAGNPGGQDAPVGDAAPEAVAPKGVDEVQAGTAAPSVPAPADALPPGAPAAAQPEEESQSSAPASDAPPAEAGDQPDRDPSVPVSSGPPEAPAVGGPVAGNEEGSGSSPGS